MPTVTPTVPTPERRREYLRGIAHAIVVVSIRCRIIGPTSLALDLTSPRGTHVFRFEMQRYIGAKLLRPEHLVLGRIADLSDEDVAYIALALPLVAGQVWADLVSPITGHLANSMLVP